MFAIANKNEIKLIINDKGFMEHEKGMESFCPWASMVGYYLFRDTFFIELNNGLWSIIPKRCFVDTDIDLDQFKNILDEKEIVNKSNKSLEPTP